jgi:protein TonB
VTLIASAPVAEPHTPPKPLPVRARAEPKPSQPVEPLPLVAAASEAPAQFVAPTPPARELPPIDAAPRQVASPAAPSAAALVLPRFDAAYLQNPPPAYPALARRMHEQGRVLLRVLVTAEGLAERVELKTGSGAERLDRAALDAVKRWRFIPARQGEQAVSAWVVVPISFSLEG